MISMNDPTQTVFEAAFLPRLREALPKLRAASAQTAAYRRPVERDRQSLARLRRMDAMQLHAMAAARKTGRLGRIRGLGAAIRRMEAREFGWCDACGAFTGLRRIGLGPTVMRCRYCAG